MLTVKTSSSPNSPSFWSAVEEVVEPTEKKQEQRLTKSVFNHNTNFASDIQAATQNIW